MSFEHDVVTVGKKAKTKAGSGREIPISPKLKAVLQQHAAWYIEKFGEIKPEWHVFPGRKGRPKKGVERAMDPTIPMGSIAKAFDTLRKRAGVQIRPRTCATPTGPSWPKTRPWRITKTTISVGF